MSDVAAPPAVGPMTISLVVNGEPRTLAVAPHHTLLEVLRDDLALTGTKECCLVGECGSCTVRLNGEIVDSCLVLAVESDGGDVETVEGLAGGGRLTALQSAFLEKGAVQCGFCTPGQLMAADELLRRVPHPTHTDIEEGLAGNYCRCHCYYQIFEAVEAAAAAGADLGPRVAVDQGASARSLPPHVIDQ
jgi:aerobic carbon-monoxide dehydrogenase small subunit